MERNRDLWLLGEISHVPFARRKGTVAIVALGVAIVLGGARVLPLSTSLFSAAVVVALTRCVSPSEIYNLIEWRVLVLIAGMTSLGLALQETGAAEYLAHGLVEWTRPFGIYALLGTLIVLTVALTQPLSNASAAVVVIPIAIAAATEVGANPRSLAVLVTLSASLSFVAPLEPACLLVYGPGRYRFRDYVKVGSLLTLLVCLLLLILGPLFWPLY